jgi:hypothetical protein
LSLLLGTFFGIIIVLFRHFFSKEKNALENISS